MNIYIPKKKSIFFTVLLNVPFSGPQPTREGGLLPLAAVHICYDGKGPFLAHFSATKGRVFMQCATKGRILLNPNVVPLRVGVPRASRLSTFA